MVGPASLTALALPRHRVKLSGHWVASLVIAICVFATYTPVFVVSYAAQDDYGMLGAAHGSHAEDLWTDQLPNGRPLGGVVAVAAYHAVSSIDGLRFVRLLTVAGIVAFALILYRALTRAGLPIWVSAAGAVCLVSLPSFQVYAAWSTALPVIIALILTGFASSVVDASLAAPRREARLRVAAAAALLLAALLLYQPAAMFLWLFAFLTLIRPAVRGDHGRRVASAYIGAAVPAMAGAFVVYRLLVDRYPESGVARYSLATDVPGKLQWFVSRALVNSLNLFDLSPTRVTAVGIGLLAAAGLLVLRNGPAKQRLVLLLLALALVPLSFGQSLATKEDWASYRSIGPLAALLFVYLWVGLWGIGRLAMQAPALSRSRMQATLRALAGVALAALLSLFVLTAVVLPLWQIREPERVDWEGGDLAAAVALAVAFAAIAVAVRSTRLVERRPAVHRAGRAALTIAVAAIPAVAALLAARNVTTLFVRPLSVELNVLRAQLPAGGARHVTIIQPSWSQGPAPLKQYDEFGLPATSAAWAPAPAVLLALRDERREPPGLSITVLPPQTSRAPRALPVVDMRKLAAFHEGWSLWTLQAWRPAGAFSAQGSSRRR